MPSSRKRPCAIVIVVFATITEGTLASSGTRPRRSHALTASPPSAAGGVARLKASPASRTPRRVRKATPSRRNANRQPSVSNTMTRTAGKQTTIARRQESWTIEARIAAGSFVATRTASRPTPSTSRAARTWRRSALPVEDQQDADRRERARPEPPRNPRLGRRQSELEPAGPADEHPEQAQGRVGHLRQELFLEAQARVRVRQEEAAADRAEEREDEGAHGGHAQPGDVVVELGPRAVRGGPRGVAVVHRQLVDRRRRERGPPGRESRDDFSERRTVGDDVDRRRQRGQRRRDEEGREAEAKLDLDEPPEPRGAEIARGREPAHREEVHRAQGEEGGEDRHLGEHHDAVRRAEERAEPTDEGEREREPRGDEGRDGRERERREALEQQRRPRALAPPEPRHDEMRKAADPRRRPDLVETIERQQKTARPEPRRRVTRPRRARGERQRHPEQCEPATPGARRAAEAESAHDEPDAGEDADGGRPDVARGEKVTNRPAVIAGQRAQADGEREELRHAHDRRARGGECGA